MYLAIPAMVNNKTVWILL